MARKLPSLKYLDLSYNRLSGKPAQKSMLDLLAIPGGLVIDVTGAFFADSQY